MAKLPPPPPAPRGAGVVVPAPAGARRARRPAVVAAPPPPPPAPRIAAPAGGRRRTPPVPAVRVVAPPAGGPPPAPAPVASPPHPATDQSNWLVGLVIVALALLVWYFNPFVGKKEAVEQARPAVTATQPASAQVEQPVVRQPQPAPRTAVEQQLDATASKPLSEMSFSECEQYWLVVRGKVVEGYGNHHWDNERGCQ